MTPSLTRTLLALLASSTLIAAAGARAQTVPAVQVKFMTYNVQAPQWNPARRAQVVGTIDAQSPDVLGLHEARPAGNGAELMADLQADYEPHFTNTNDPIYLRRDRGFAVVAEGAEALPVCAGIIGGAAVLTWVRIETPEGNSFTFYNTHLCVSQLPGGGQVSPEGNQLQAISTAVFMSLNAEPGSVQLLAGDLNAGQTSPTLLYLSEGQPLVLGGIEFGNPVELDDTWERAPGNAGQAHPGTTAGGGFTALDWILADSSVNIVAAEVIQFDIPPGEEAGYSDHLPVTATILFPGLGNASLEIQVSQQSYVDGEVVVVSSFRLANPGPEAMAVELKVWLEVPGFSALSRFNLGADGSLVIPAGFDAELGPFVLFGVSGALPRGDYGFSSRLLHPVTGELLNQDLNAFTIQ